MSTQGRGSFEVKATPHPPYDERPGASLRRMTIEKQFAGDLAGSSVVEMLSAVSTVQGSAAYVAIERIEGTLHGRSGSFVVHHTGVMHRGLPSLQIAVVPDSGAGDLTGISGSMSIDIRDGKHFYTIEYVLESG